MEDLQEALLATSIRMHSLYRMALSLCSVKTLDELIPDLLLHCITAIDVETACLLDINGTLHVRGADLAAVDQTALKAASWRTDDAYIHGDLPSGPPFLAHPIRQEADVIAVLIVAAPGNSGFDPTDLNRMEDLARITATALKNAYAYEDLVGRAEELAENTENLQVQLLGQERQHRRMLEAKNAELIRHTRALEQRNQFIRSVFGRYLTDGVVEQLLESSDGLKVGGERREVSVLMADLCGFTALSERWGPESVVALLNNYLGKMTDVIIRYEGTIDEFIGDAILVIFGAPVQKPDHAQRAVACAVEMQLAMDAVNAENQKHGLPNVEMGVAVNSGEAVVGNIGSPRRAKYGVVGEPVNLASRIESYTVGGQILISDAAYRGCGAVHVATQFYIEPKGVAERILVYDVGGIGAPYNLFLPTAEEEMIAPAPHITVRYTVLEEKFVGRTVFEARIVKLSSKGAELWSENRVSPLSNLKIQVIDDKGEQIPADLFGKALDRRTDEPSHFYVRFTSMPEAVERFFAALRV